MIGRPQIFTFASNLAGHHHGGSAREAREKHGALWGCGIGPQGDSYAIPTMDEFLAPLSLDRIAVHVANFIDYAAEEQDKDFNIVAIGCGIAGFKPEQIAPMFARAPANCKLPAEFINRLSNQRKGSMT